jgi:hypothetical protein
MTTMDNRVGGGTSRGGCNVLYCLNSHVMFSYLSGECACPPGSACHNRTSCDRTLDWTQVFSTIYAFCRMWKDSRQEEEGWLFYGVYKQAYIHERHECTRKYMMSKERQWTSWKVLESTVLRYRADNKSHRCTWWGRGARLTPLMRYCGTSSLILSQSDSDAASALIVIIIRPNST